MEYVIQNKPLFNTMAQLIIRIPDRDKNLLGLLAEQQAKSISQLVRSAIKNLLNKTNNQTPVLLQLANLAKLNKNGPKNLSKKYKKLLYGRLIQNKK